MIRRFILGIIGAAALAGVAQAETQTETPALYLIQYSAGPAWRVGDPMEAQALGPHVAYMRQLQAEGSLFAAGPYLNAEGGMAMIVAANDEAADAILAADPAVQAGVFVAELRRWRPVFRGDGALPAAS